MLNGAENRETIAGHFIAESVGSSVQHIAFAANDIFAATNYVSRGARAEPDTASTWTAPSYS